jgi:hypothetical protein
MKRLLSVCLLMLCLSFPVFGGHTVSSGYACECRTPGCVEDYAGECDGQVANQQGATPNDDAMVLGIALVALLFWLRLKA